MVHNNKNAKSSGLLPGVIFWFFAIAATATLVVAHADTLTQAPVVLQQSSVLAGEETPPAEEQADEMQIIDASPNGGAIQSITFKKDMSIKDALRFLSLKYQKNIVPSEKVEGNITVTNLYNVTFDEALEAILGTNKYEVQGNFIRVYTLDEFQKDRTRFAQEVINLYYISAAEAQKLVMPLLSDAGKIAATSAAAIDTEAGEGGDTVAVRDQLVISDYPERVQAVKKLIESIDVRPPQVLIEVTVLEATLDETTKFGIDFNTYGIKVDQLGEEGLSQTGFTQVSSGLNIGILNDRLQVLINALETTTDTTILANTKILALNKQAGKLHIGREDGYQSSTTISDGGNSTQQVEMLESGTKLEFRPFICKDGFIRMEIYPEQSTGTVDKTTTPVLPSKTLTTVKTNVMVEDGKTIVLGGLFQEKTILGRSQVPLLGDIPVIGDLFKKVADQSVRTELIVLITPHIIHEPSQAEGGKRIEDARRISALARDNIFWMSRARINEDRYEKAVKYYLDGDLESALYELSGDNEMNRTFHEARRLKEKIISEIQPGGYDSLQRIMTEKLEKEESEKWFRR